MNECLIFALMSTSQLFVSMMEVVPDKNFILIQLYYILTLINMWHETTKYIKMYYKSFEDDGYLENRKWTNSLFEQNTFIYKCAMSVAFTQSLHVF